MDLEASCGVLAAVVFGMWPLALLDVGNEMTTLREAAQQALEALEQSETTVQYEGFGMARREAERKHQAAITALKAALAEQTQNSIVDSQEKTK